MKISFNEQFSFKSTSRTITNYITTRHLHPFDKTSKRLSQVCSNGVDKQPYGKKKIFSNTSNHYPGIDRIVHDCCWTQNFRTQCTI